MRINYVADVFGIRQVKQCLALGAMGYEVRVAFNTWHDMSFLPAFKRQAGYYMYPGQIQSLLDDDADLTIVRFDLAEQTARTVLGLKPTRLVFDVNDWYPHYTDEHAGLLRQASQVMVPSNRFAPGIDIGSRVVVHNACPEGMYKLRLISSGPRMAGTVGYAGGAGISPEYRDYRKLTAQLKEQGWTLFLYADMPLPVQREYEMAGGFVVTPRHYLDMIRALKRHDLLWVGGHGGVMQGVVRNAMFDASLTGRPAISFGLPDQDPWVTNHDFSTWDDVMRHGRFSPVKPYPLENDIGGLFTTAGQTSNP